MNPNEPIRPLKTRSKQKNHATDTTFAAAPPPGGGGNKGERRYPSARI